MTRKFTELREKMAPRARAEVRERADLILENIRLRTALEIVRDTLAPGTNAAGLYFLTESTLKVVKAALEVKSE